MGKYEKFFKFIQYTLDSNGQDIPDDNRMDWQNLYRFAHQQSILGVVYAGVKRLGEQGGKPPFDILMELVTIAEQIKGQNRLLNKRCIEVVKEYRDAGFLCCVLKGQGNSAMYDIRCKKEDGRVCHTENTENLALLRTPGDIDLWVKPKDRRCKKKETRSVVKYVKEHHNENVELRYYHIGYVDRGIEVEAHFMPNIMNNPVCQHRLQKWYNKMADGGWMKKEVELPDGVGSIPVPTIAFNIVFQLAHMMHHFFDEGIGLRQFMDYYFVLKTQNEGEGEIENVTDSLRYLGLYKFAMAVMYIMREVFGLDEKYMIAPIDERRGKTLLNEILKGGNFGHYSGLDQNNALKKFFQKTWRNIQLVKEYPAEALCEPLFRTWHLFWRIFHRCL